MSRTSAVSRYTAILNSIGIACKGLNSVFISMVKTASFVQAVDPEVPTLLISVKKKVFGRERIRCVADLVVTWQNIPVVARDISVVGTQADIDEKFFNELYLSTKLFNSSLTERSIEKVVFFEGVDLYKWDDFFNENFGVTLEALQLEDILHVDQTDGISIGAGISELVLPTMKINLLGLMSVKK